MTVECMNGVTGERTHLLFTPADYTVSTHTATAEHHMCRQCLLTLLRKVDGENVAAVEICRQITTAYDRQRHAEVLRHHSARKRGRSARSMRRP